MATQGSGGDKPATHVNMMIDTIIANIPENGLRRVMRAVLATYPNTTDIFTSEAKNYLHDAAENVPAMLTTPGEAESAQKIVRCMMGAGLCFSSLPILSSLVRQAPDLQWTSEAARTTFLATLDADVVQAMSAVQKVLFSATGSRALSAEEESSIKQLYEALQGANKSTVGEHHYHRALLSAASTLGLRDSITNGLFSDSDVITPPSTPPESFQINEKAVPRIFAGLWQLSSPAWGSAAMSDMQKDLATYVENGFTAFDMADHYGDAEILFGRFLSGYPFKDAMFTATKTCVFHRMNVTREAIAANIEERCRRLQQSQIDLLQFHWQFYDDPQYIDALRYINEDERVVNVGLCNFDTERMEAVIESGIPIVTNQVQLGGFLAEKWLDRPPPDTYGKSITPSQRKYYEMIRNWGGWELFQELLATLHTIAIKHGVSISNVAVRWVLDFPYVGAVIIGARMGISQHTAENLASLGWFLDADDQSAIETVLKRSKRDRLVDMLGDCGGEYRQ